MRRSILFLVAGLAVALGLAFFLGPHASSQPDGLNRVAIDHGFDGAERDSATAGGVLAGYSVRGVDDGGLATGLAGVAGVVVTFAIAGGLFVLVRRRPAPASS
jgi:hypothetical protein